VLKTYQKYINIRAHYTVHVFGAASVGATRRNPFYSRGHTGRENNNSGRGKRNFRHKRRLLRSVQPQSHSEKTKEAQVPWKQQKIGIPHCAKILVHHKRSYLLVQRFDSRHEKHVLETIFDTSTRFRSQGVTEL